MIVFAEISHWVHDLNPVIWQITESLAVRWYGMAYLAGFVLSFALLYVYWRRGLTRLGPPQLESMAMAMILGVVIGGRLGYFLLYAPELIFSNPLVFFMVWEGGMASHGGFLGVAVATIWVARKNQLGIFELGDLVASVAAGGLLFGRIANFINGELWGKVTDVSWAVIFPASAPLGTPLEWIAPRHPSQLYQALLEGLLLFLFMQWRFWRGHGRGNPLPGGQLTGEFFVFYAIARMIGEHFREPDAALILGLSRGSFYSIGLLLCGVIFIAWSRSRRLTSA
jgi:phosphatidylglycerol:prolipoprotein diacylglycerol transferase